MTTLPRSSTYNWVRASLGELGTLHCGQSPTSTTVNQTGNGTPYVTGPDQWEAGRLRADKWTTDPRRMVPEGCVFVTVKGAGVGTVFPGIACAIGRDIYAFEPCAGLYSRFAEQIIRFDVANLLQHAVGDIPGLSRSHLENFEIPIPPLPEQYRIVEAIESYFSRLDDVVATTERVQRDLKRYRATVLKAAVEGQLVPTEAELARAERRGFEPASALLERILIQRRHRWETSSRRGKYKAPFTPDEANLPKLPEGWCWATIEQLTTLITKGTTPTSVGHTFTESGIRFVKVESLVRNHVDHGRCAHISNAADAALSRSRLEPHDVLFSIAGTLGRVALVRRADVPANTNQAVAILRLVLPTVAPYLLWALQRPRMSLLVRGERRGVGIYNLNLEQVAGMPIPLPPEAEQPRIVAAMEKADSQASSVLENVAQGKSRCVRLGQSILKWAFQGKLADQDASDEPAKVLLERIRAERGGTTPAMKGRSNGRVRATA